jgi:hypothetical protein
MPFLTRPYRRFLVPFPKLPLAYYFGLENIDLY